MVANIVVIVLGVAFLAAAAVVIISGALVLLARLCDFVKWATYEWKFFRMSASDREKIRKELGHEYAPFLQRDFFFYTATVAWLSLSLWLAQWLGEAVTVLNVAIFVGTLACLFWRGQH